VAPQALPVRGQASSAPPGAASAQPGSRNCGPRRASRTWMPPRRRCSTRCRCGGQPAH